MPDQPMSVEEALTWLDSHAQCQTDDDKRNTADNDLLDQTGCHLFTSFSHICSKRFAAVSTFTSNSF